MSIRSIGWQKKEENIVQNIRASFVQHTLKYNQQIVDEVKYFQLCIVNDIDRQSVSKQTGKLYSNEHLNAIRKQKSSF